MKVHNNNGSITGFGPAGKITILGPSGESLQDTSSEDGKPPFVPLLPPTTSKAQANVQGDKPINGKCCFCDHSNAGSCRVCHRQCVRKFFEHPYVPKNFKNQTMCLCEKCKGFYTTHICIYIYVYNS